MELCYNALPKPTKQLQTKHLGVTMTIREKVKSQDLAYQDKLALHLKSKQSQLETILRVSMPHQLTNMKTILWINILFVGFSFHLFVTLGWSNYLISFYTAVSLSLFSILFAMLQKRSKSYGEIEDIDYAFSLPDTLQGHTTMLSALLKNCDIGIQENKKIMSYLSKYMHFSTWMTLLSIILFIGCISFQISTKGGDTDMAHAKTPPSKVVVELPRPINETSERSLKTPPPKPMPQPKPKD